MREYSSTEETLQVYSFGKRNVLGYICTDATFSVTKKNVLLPVECCRKRQMSFSVFVFLVNRETGLEKEIKLTVLSLFIRVYRC